MALAAVARADAKGRYATPGVRAADLGQQAFAGIAVHRVYRRLCAEMDGRVVDMRMVPPPIAGASQPRSVQARAVRSAGGWSPWQAVHQASALQRLAFAACFTGLGALCDDLGVTSAQILYGLVRRSAGGYEKVARSAALLDLSALAVAARAVAQGWH